jgi:hypothetical protein
MRTQQKIILMIAVLAVSVVPLQAQTQAANIDLFEELHRHLLRAADVQLGQIHDKATPNKTSAEFAGDADPRIFGSSLFSGITLARVTAAQVRLLGLGVDAARVFVEEGVPLELLVVAEVESRYRPLALSPKGARGPWQLMPSTATHFGLRVDEGKDERIQAKPSTRAAARYLRELHSQFGDWMLALAAYNSGEGRISEAIERGGTRDFRRLAEKKLLPGATLKYVSAVVAAKERH